MPLPLHLLIHLSVALLTGYAVGWLFKRIDIGLLGGLWGGFFIDLDHVLEYFLIFGPSFNIVKFLAGQQFLASEKIYILFHAWEYIPILLLIAWLIRKCRAWSILVVTVAVSALLHLASDCLINNYPPRNYSLLYRYQVNFQAREILSPTQYQEFIEYKRYFAS